MSNVNKTTSYQRKSQKKFLMEESYKIITEQTSVNMSSVMTKNGIC
ncbi:unnamed protein product [Paramecium pentaurelia]|uniref:Uncharacterized protein n=1 Tax=Paramecium pentaurelia TaxID=43138 RepID=A0A8S1X5J9_9CILI|nr:unnamed protein product [Paramecium pentaurelia]